MGCCASINTSKQVSKEDLEIFISNIESNKYITFNVTSKNSNSKKQESQTPTNKLFPSSLIKSKENPNGIVVIKMKN